MKHFLIKYHFENGSQEEWHREIARFIAALEADPELAGRIAYRALKAEGGDYYHLAAAADAAAAAALNERAFFAHYTAKCDVVSGGSLEVVPLEVVSETSFRA